MRKILLAMTTALLFTGGACKKSETDQANDQLQKAQERVQDEGANLREQEQDVRQPDSVDDQAQQGAGDAMASFKASAHEQLAKIDAQISDLKAKGTTVSEDELAKLERRRDQISAQLDQLGDQASAGAVQAQNDIKASLDQLEQDIDDISG